MGAGERGEEGEEPASEQKVKDRGIKQAKRWRRAQRFVRSKESKLPTSTKFKHLKPAFVILPSRGRRPDHKHKLAAHLISELAELFHDYFMFSGLTE